MTIREQYKDYESRREHAMCADMSPYWFDQESRYVPPFRVYGNVWYVGDSWVCVHLIDTGAGLLLIDSGNAGATALLIQSIWAAGFDPADVKWIIHSHGHVDHIGAANFFRRMFGTKLYLGAPDARMFRECPELSMIQESCDLTDALFVPDYEIKEGDVLLFGNTEIQFFLVPGHTEGCIACFFNVQEGSVTKRCGYYGGFGFNTLRKDFLIEIGDPTYRMRQVYLDSLAKVREQKVDIFLGNHCINNQTCSRREKQRKNPTAPNPFVDDKAWGAYLDEKRDALLKFSADPANN